MFVEISLRFISMKAIIEKAWELREEISEFDSSTIAAIKEALKGLDEGKISVSEKVNGLWVTNTWLKKAILLSFLCRQTESGRRLRKQPFVPVWTHYSPASPAEFPMARYHPQKIRSGRRPSCFHRFPS